MRQRWFQSLLGRVISRGWIMALAFLVVVAGCHSGGRTKSESRADRAAKARNEGRKVAIRKVACLYDQRPWLNCDVHGDRDPEGLWYRVFLDPGTGKGVLAKGTFHVEMYRIDHEVGEMKRTLISDWHYPSEQISTIQKPGLLGEGYVLQLIWADKATAGKEVEIMTRFEDALGNVSRSGTKRLRVPKYDS